MARIEGKGSRGGGRGEAGMVKMRYGREDNGRRGRCEKIKECWDEKVKRKIGIY